MRWYAYTSLSAHGTLLLLANHGGFGVPLVGWLVLWFTITTLFERPLLPLGEEGEIVFKRAICLLLLAGGALSVNELGALLLAVPSVLVVTLVLNTLQHRTQLGTLPEGQP